MNIGAPVRTASAQTLKSYYGHSCRGRAGVGQCTANGTETLHCDGGDTVRVVPTLNVAAVRRVQSYLQIRSECVASFHRLVGIRPTK